MGTLITLRGLCGYVWVSILAREIAESNQINEHPSKSFEVTSVYSHGQKAIPSEITLPGL